MKHAVEIILTLSATSKGSADQQCVDAKTKISLFLDRTTYFLKYNITHSAWRTDSQDQTISLSFAVCLVQIY